MITWKWRTFDELTKQELYDILALREKVFILEQKCFYVDLDYRDQQSMHLLGLIDDKLAGYLRVLPTGLAYSDAMSFGRVVTAPFARGKGFGKKMLEETLLYFKKNHPNEPITISAQIYLEKFYQSYGFKTISEPYDDEGIIHVDMKKHGKHE